MLAFEKSIGALVYRKKGDEIKFLLLHYISGHWSFVKGHSEKGESEEDTLRRETWEESGIKNLEIRPDFREKMFYFYRANGPEARKRKFQGKGTHIFKKVIYYLAESETENITLSQEHKGFAWLNYEEALVQVTHKNPRRILRKAGKYLKISNA